SCARPPEADGTVNVHDHGYCVLAEPIDLAIVPPLLGCELDSLSIGQGLVTIGWGLSETGSGIKRISTSQFLGWHEGMIGASFGSNEVCPGDSGGPTYARLTDGSWRLVGVSGGGPPGDIADCVDPLLIIPAAQAIAWIEEQTGIDVSPCHLADGTWAPESACTGFAMNPGPTTGHHPWVDGSCADPRSGPVATCGPSFEHDDESEPPLVEIVAPADGAHYPNAPARIDVEIAADDGDGVAVIAVELLANGEVVAGESITNPLEQPSSWTFTELELAEGEHELTAIATDYWGNVGVAEPTTIIVGDGEPATDPDDPSSEPGSCACAAGQRRVEPTILLVLLLALRRRRSWPPA